MCCGALIFLFFTAEERGRDIHLHPTVTADAGCWHCHDRMHTVVVMRFRSFNFLRWFSFISCWATKNHFGERKSEAKPNEPEYRHEPLLRNDIGIYSVMHAASSTALPLPNTFPASWQRFQLYWTAKCVCKCVRFVGRRRRWIHFLHLGHLRATKRSSERWYDEFAIYVNGKIIFGQFVYEPRKMRTEWWPFCPATIAARLCPFYSHIRSTFSRCQFRHRQINLSLLLFCVIRA